MAAEGDDAPFGAGDFTLQRLVKTAAGQDLYVASMAQSALEKCDWGDVLRAAPEALGRLGQCFVLASDPLAATLTFPSRFGLPYSSLKANLVECSDKGRAVFRDAERKMKRVLGFSSTVCEPGGTIDMILEAVKDDDLLELDLPEQLSVLKRISQACVDDTTALRNKVDEWSKFAKSIHTACVDRGEKLQEKEIKFGNEVKIEEIAVDKKRDAVEESKKQTTQYRRQLAARQLTYDKAERSHSTVPLIDIAIDFAARAGDISLNAANAYLNPLSAVGSAMGGAISGIKNIWSSQKTAHVDSNQSDTTPIQTEDNPGIKFPELLIAIYGSVSKLLTEGTAEEAGVNWTELKSQADQLVRSVGDTHETFTSQPSQSATSVQEIHLISEKGEKILLEIQQLVHTDSRFGSNMISEGIKCAPLWQSQMKDTVDALKGQYQVLLKTAKAIQLKMNEVQNEAQNTKTTKDDRRYNLLLLSERHLRESEGRLNKRLEEDLKMDAAFTAMQLELERLLTTKVTISQVREIVGKCVSNLVHFCQKLDELAFFFAEIQRLIEEMNSTRVKPFVHMAEITKKLADRNEVETSEEGKKRREKTKQNKLNNLRLRALQLKGYYLVAKGMADTYTEISQKYIIPAVNSIDMLSLPEGNRLTQRQDELIKPMSDNRGDIPEQLVIGST